MSIERDRERAAAHMRAGRIADGERLYRRILRDAPDDGDALEKLGFILRGTERRDEAVDLMRRLAGILPEEPGVLVNLGNTLVELGRHGEGLEALERAAETAPDLALARFSYGSALLNAGRGTDAQAQLEATVELQPQLAEAWRLLTLVRDFSAGDPLIAEMEGLLSDDGLDRHARVHLDYALGNVRDRLGESGPAFAHFAAANRALRDSCRVPLGAYEEYFADLRKTFDESLIGNRTVDAAGGVTPIFIVGLPRCGSTLLEVMLARHGDAGSAGEATFLAQEVTRKLPGTGGRRFPANVPAADQTALAGLAGNYLKRLAGTAPGAAFVTDKNLAHFQLVGLIRMLLPKARVIHVTREPRDMCWSIYRNFFPENLPFYCDLSDLGRYWRMYMDLMAYWRELMPGFVHDVSYEDLVAGPEAEMRKVLEFCGLGWDPACLSPEDSKAPIRTISAMQARKPVYTSSVGGWTRYEEHLGPLIKALGV